MLFDPLSEHGHTPHALRNLTLPSALLICMAVVSAPCLAHDDGLPSPRAVEAAAASQPQNPGLLLNGQIEQMSEMHEMQQLQQSEPARLPKKKKRNPFRAFGAHLVDAGKGIVDQSRALAGQAVMLNGFTQSDVGIIGVKFITTYGHLPVVARVYPSTPASYMDVRPHDVILAVDNVPTAGLSSVQIYSMIVGPPNTEVSLTLNRFGAILVRRMMRMDFSEVGDRAVRNEYMVPGGAN